MRSHILRLLLVSSILPLGGCGYLQKAEEPTVQPVQVKKAPAKKAVAAPVQKKVIKKPVVAPTPANERGDYDSGGGGGPGDWEGS